MECTERCVNRLHAMLIPLHLRNQRVLCCELRPILMQCRAVVQAHGPAAAKARADEPKLDGIIPLTHQDQQEDEALAALGAHPAAS